MFQRFSLLFVGFWIVISFCVKILADSNYTGRVMYRLKEQAGPSSQAEINEQIHPLSTRTCPPPLSYTVADLGSISQAQAALTYLQQNSDVETAFLEGFVTLCLIPTDPYYATFQTALSQVNLPSAWDITTGLSTTVVAVLDSGIRASHEEFSGKTMTGYDFVNMDSDPNDDIASLHGTLVSGIIAANTNNAKGGAGICWTCMILPVKVASSSGLVATGDATSGIVYAADQGAQVINMSFAGLGSAGDVTAYRTAINYARGKGCVLVAAAGNHTPYGASNEGYVPCSQPGVISVAAVDDYNVTSYFSNYGSTVDLCAPGEEIFGPNTDPSSYATNSGTSFSSPIVAGIAALLHSYRTTLTPDEIEDLLKVSARDLGPAGRDDHYGFGLVDGGRALYFAQHNLLPITAPAAGKPAFHEGATLPSTAATSSGAGKKGFLSCARRSAASPLSASSAWPTVLFWLLAGLLLFRRPRSRPLAGLFATGIFFFSSR